MVGESLRAGWEWELEWELRLEWEDADAENMGEYISWACRERDMTQVTDWHGCPLLAPPIHVPSTWSHGHSISICVLK